MKDAKLVFLASHPHLYQLLIKGEEGGHEVVRGLKFSGMRKLIASTLPAFGNILLLSQTFSAGLFR